MPGVPALPESRWAVLGPDGRSLAGGFRPRGRWHRASVASARGQDGGGQPFDVRGYDPERKLYEWEGALPPIMRRAEEYAARHFMPAHSVREKTTRLAGGDLSVELVKTPVEVSGRFQLMRPNGRGVRLAERLVRNRREFWALAKSAEYRAAKLLEAGDYFSHGGDASLPVPLVDPLQLSNTEYAPVTNGPWCLHGETPIPLLDGTMPTIRELAETRSTDAFWVYSCDRRGMIVPGRAHAPRRTGERVFVVRITLDNGEGIICTPEHKFLLRSGSYRQAGRLRPGDSLMPLYRGLVRKGRYVYERVRHPATGEREWTHRMVVRSLGSGVAVALRGAQVHHENRNARDNRPENLTLKATMGAHMREHPWPRTAAWRAQAATRARARWGDPGYRTHMARRIARAWRRPGFRDATGAAISGSLLGNPNVRAAALARWADPAFRERALRSIRAANVRPERRVKVSSAQSLRWARDAQGKAALTERTRAAWADSEHRARRCAAMRKPRARRAVEENHRVVGVAAHGYADVYDVTVDRYNNFGVGQGVFLHNSKQLYIYDFWAMISRCLHGDTRVPLLDGTTPTIRELAAAQLADACVYSCTPSGAVVPGRVRAARQTGTQVPVVRVLLDTGEALVCTPEHMVMLRSGRYRPAEKLGAGDELMAAGVVHVAGVEPAGLADVFDLTVDGHHNFSVGQSRVVVHNSFEALHHSPIARAAVNITTDFTLGRGVTWRFQDSGGKGRALKQERREDVVKSMRSGGAPGIVEQVQQVWEEFWKRNKMGWRLRVLTHDQSWQGELMVQYDEVEVGGEPGYLRVRSRDPSGCWEVVGDPDDSERVAYFAFQYPCLAGGTRIACADGTEPTIAELAQRGLTARKPAWVYSYDVQTGRVVPGKATRCWRAGRKRCVEVQLDNGQSVVASFDHPFLLRSGQYAHAERLCPGDALMPLYRPDYEEVYRPGVGRRLSAPLPSPRTLHAAPWMNHKVVAVRSAGMRVVYDLQVEQHHNFGLACGVFTHNSAYIYALGPMKWPDGTPVEVQRYVVEQVPPENIYWTKVNSAAVERRGRSDLFPILTWIKRVRDTMTAISLRKMLEANLIWKLKVKGDQADIDAVANDSDLAVLPPPGGLWIENEAMDLEPMHAPFAGGRGQDGTIADLVAMCAMALQLPPEYLAIGGAGGSRAAALTKSEPAVKRFESRRRSIEDLLQDAKERVVRHAVRHGRLAKDAARVDTQFDFPSLFAEDRTAKVRDVIVVRGAQAISHRTAATMMANELEITDYDYEAEQRAIEEEDTNPVLKLYAERVPGAPGDNPEKMTLGAQGAPTPFGTAMPRGGQPAGGSGEAAPGGGGPLAQAMAGLRARAAGAGGGVPPGAEGTEGRGPTGQEERRKGALARQGRVDAEGDTVMGADDRAEMRRELKRPPDGLRVREAGDIDGLMTALRESGAEGVVRVEVEGGHMERGGGSE